MINETFVASDPKSAYEQAVEEVWRRVFNSFQQNRSNMKMVSYVAEVCIAVPKDLFMERSFGKISTEYTNPENEEDESLLAELGELKKQLSR